MHHVFSWCEQNIRSLQKLSKGKYKFVPVLTTKTYSRCRTMVPLILTSALGGGDGSDLSRGRSAPKKETHYSFNMRLLGPRAGLNVLDKRKFSCPYWVRTQYHPPLNKICSNSYTGLERPWGFQEIEASSFQNSRLIKLIRLLALGTGHLYPPGDISGTHFCLRLSQPQGHSATGRIMSMKNSNDTIWNRTRYLPACSAVTS